jgi:hypothetical protein
MIESIDVPLALATLGEEAYQNKRRRKMAETGDDRLRALIRLIPPVRALKEDLEQSIHLETFAGTGDLAVRSFQGLQASVARITDDPYVGSLALTVPEGAGDKEKVSLARLAAGQLVGYLEGQTGLVGLGGGGEGRSHINVQRAPMINLTNVEGLPAEAFGKLVEKAAGTMKSAEESEEPEA